MTLNKAHKDLEHNHKVVFVYASHRQILRPSTFHLLYHRALHDAILRSFLETAYEAIRCEASAAADSPELERSGAPALPASFEGLAETTAAPLFSFFVLSLTTLAQIGTVLAARQDFKDAMSGDFPAVWDPESFLTMRILHTTDASSTLEVIARAIETIRLATWLDMFLSPGSSEEAHGRLERLTVRGGDGLHAVLDKCRQDNNLIQQTLYGFTLGVSPHGPEAGVLHKSQGVLVTEKSKVPLLDEAQWTRIHDGLQACIEKRRIGVSLCPGMALCGDPSSIIEVDLADIFRMPDIGRSQAQSDGALAQLAHGINLSRVYIPNVNVLLVGGTTNDACISAVTRHLTSQAVPHEHIKLLNLLLPKDSQRFGNEPVNLSKVKGNPCEQIAIVGMSCRVPGASDADDLWRLLKEGKDTLQEIPERLYRYQDYHSASYRDRNVMRVRTANCLSNPSLFDKSLLEGVGSVDDCAKLDPQQRLAILTTHEALQRAGYGFSPRHPPKHPQQWSSHFAYCSDDYREHLSRDIDGSLVSSTHRAHLVARVNETFGFRGEACSYDTACSSALAAVEGACSSLLAGETSAAVTGGVNIITQPQITIGLDRGFFLSPSSQCMTLDDAGSGYSRADAVSIMLLKRLTDAVRDKDPILAVISSAATNHSGESFSITHPHGETQCRLYQSGMLASGTLPRDYSYIEMHGTGTQSGDLEEVTGIVETFGAKKRPGESPLVLGSVKANVGHSEAASGATSMIKTIQIYNHDLVPRHIGIRTKLNTKLPPLDGLHIPLEETKIDRLNSTFTLVDNFSAAGGNSSIIMDRGSRYRERLLSLSKEAEAMPDDSVSSVKQHLLFVTAATPFSLDANRRQLIAFLDQNRDVSLREFCSNVSLSDAMYRYRLIGTPATLAEAKACLSSQESICVSDRSVKDMAIGIAFSGQGAQYLDMGRELYEHSPTFRRHVDACNTIALSLGLPALVAVIHPGCNEASAQRDSTVGTRAADAFSPAQYQLALTAVEVGLTSLLLDWGLKPACLVGHSLGEYTAMWMSGILSLHSLIDLVGRRALLMMERCQPNATSMLAIRVHHAQVAQLLKESGSESLEIACMNSPNDTVVAGSTVEIETLMRLCEHKEPKIKAMAIPVPYAFHSKAVEPLMEDYAEVAARHRFSQPKISIASNVLGQVIDGRNASITADYLVRHLRQPVRFCEAILDLQSKLQIDTWVEVGPHPTCIPMLKGCYAESEHAPAFLASFRRGSSSWSSILGLVKELASRGIDLDWGKAFGDLGLRFCHKGLSASLPLYPFDYEEHWIPFKDRGLRDGLNPASIKQPDAAETSTKREVPSKSRLPRPSYALLSQCVRLEADPPSALFLARTNQRPFSDMIKGHIILGTELAPATVFVELAQEAGMYWWDLDAKAARPAGQKEEDVVIEVLELSMVASLYLNERDPKQSIEVSLQGDPWSHGGSIVQFFSHSEHRHQKHQYGACRIRIVSVDAAQHDWTKLAHLIQTAAAKVQADSSSVIKTKTVYRNFEAIVKYLGGFRGMETVWLSEGGEEATSEVRHHNEAAHGRFVCSPMLLDSLGGLTGFISNVRFAEGPYVYMADGIGRIVTLPGLRKMQPGGATSVRVYARMQRDKDLSRGDAYFFLPDGRFMGSMEEIVFKRIRRDMLLRLVQLSSKAFFNEADRAVKAQPSANVHESDNPSQNSAGRSSTNQPKPIPGLESKANGSAAHSARLQGETSSDSPMNELTDPSKRSNASKPRHIAGPQLKHFDGRDVLFLFPDGSGTSQMYPRVDTGGRLSIYGFDSPYLGHIGAWSRGVGELVDQYVEMLCRAQPHGPYRLGGWSIGGVVVLEVCRRLLSLGHEVAFVGLIDTPSPLQIKPIPTGTLDEMLGRIASPTVREHFRSCALSLPGYRCLAFAENDAKPAKITVVNAAHDSGLKPVMASEPEWRTFWSDMAHLAWHQVAGDHWTCLEPALRLIVESAR